MIRFEIDWSCRFYNYFRRKFLLMMTLMRNEPVAILTCLDFWKKIFVKFFCHCCFLLCVENLLLMFWHLLNSLKQKVLKFVKNTIFHSNQRCHYKTVFDSFFKGLPLRKRIWSSVRIPKALKRNRSFFLHSDLWIWILQYIQW